MMRVYFWSKKGGIMTRNQIEYWNLRETSKHNRRTERETSKHNRATEAEDKRSHLAGEAQNRSNLAETGRHNRAQENIDISKLRESSRHNIATEGLTGVDLNIRQQVADEQERANKAKEEIATYNAITDRNKALTDKAYKEAQAQTEAFKAAMQGSKTQSDIAYAEKQLKIAQQNADTAYKNYKSAATKNKAEAFQKYSQAVNEWLRLITMLKTAKG